MFLADHYGSLSRYYAILEPGFYESEKLDENPIQTRKG